jgi:hypothetical protein
MSKFGINVPDGKAAQSIPDVVKAAKEMQDEKGEVHPLPPGCCYTCERLPVVLASATHLHNSRLQSLNRMSRDRQTASKFSDCLPRHAASSSCWWCAEQQLSHSSKLPRSPPMPCLSPDVHAYCSGLASRQWCLARQPASPQKWSDNEINSSPASTLCRLSSSRRSMRAAAASEPSRTA